MLLGIALVVWLTAAPAAPQETSVAVVAGLGGEPEHADTFRRWAGSLVDHATGPLGMPAGRILYLTGDPQLDAKRAPGKATKDAVVKGLTAIGETTKADDVVFVVLI